MRSKKSKRNRSKRKLSSENRQENAAQQKNIGQQGNKNQQNNKEQKDKTGQQENREQKDKTGQRGYSNWILAGQAFRICFILLGMFVVFRFFLPLFLPFVIALLLAGMLYPVVRWMHRCLRLPVYLAGCLSLTAFLGALVFIVFYVGRALFGQLAAFFENFAVYQAYLTEQVSGLCRGCDRIFRLESGTAIGVLEAAMKVMMERVQTDVLPALTTRTLQFAAGSAVIIGIVLIIIVSALLMIKDMELYRKQLRRWRRYPLVDHVVIGLTGGAAAYLKTQLTLLLIMTAILTVGLALIGNPYALVFGLGIAVFDAFPLLGSGLLLIPWALVKLIAGDYFRALVLAILFLICQVIREVVEPKLLGGKLGVRPVAAMMAVYVGIQLFGIAGVVLGPLGLILLRVLLKT